ncbi:MAG: ribonuclease Z [Haliangiales bacterium]
MLSTLKTGRHTVRGLSLGGVYTSLMVPELGAMFDVGVAPRSFAGAKRLFLSHGHADHVGALMSFLGLRALMGHQKPLEVFMPAEICEQVQTLLAAAAPLQRYALEIDPRPMEPGQEIAISKSLSVRSFRTFHPVPSLGYLFVRRVDKLKPAFADLPGPEIGRRRKAGEDLFDRVERLELAYATDTLAQVLDSQPALYEVPTLILECTFLDQRKSLEASRKGCHIHLDELIERAERFRNQALVLMHFSQLYKPAEVPEILAKRCPAELHARIRALVPKGNVWPG